MRPPISITAAMTTPIRRRLRSGSITSNLHAFGAEPPLHLRLNLPELLLGSRLEPHYQYWLRVRGPNETPPVAKQDTYSVDRDDFVSAGEILLRFLDDSEFRVVGTINAN